MRFPFLKPWMILCMSGLLILCGGRAASAQTQDEPAAGADDSLGMLVTAADLSRRPSSDELAIVDARSEENYNEGHIPGAARVDVGDWRNLALSEGGLHNSEAWGERVGRLGISRDTPVVVYSDSPTNAARIWWTLKYVGVEQVALLDGGWNAWTEAGGATSSEAPEVQAVQFQPEFQPERVAEIDDVKAGLETGAITIIDARSLGEFAGTAGRGARRGHIPGATQLEWSEFLDEDGTFKSQREIQMMLITRGISPEGNNVTHCQTGGRASLNAFAFELAGLGVMKNYYCGWSEWSGDEAAPVETGEPAPADEE